jgi:hypothetical protein
VTPDTTVNAGRPRPHRWQFPLGQRRPGLDRPLQRHPGRRGGIGRHRRAIDARSWHGRGADDKHQQLIRANHGQCGPGGDQRADRAKPQPGRDVGRQSRADTQRKQPPGQPGRWHPAPGGVEHRHAGGVDRAVS